MSRRPLSASVASRWSLPDAVQSALRPFGLEPAFGEDIAAGRALAAELIGPYIAPVSTFEAVQDQTGGAALFVRREEGRVAGVLGLVPLSAAGLRAVLVDGFDAKAPDPRHITSAGDYPSAAYGWGIAGLTRSAAKAVVAATATLFEQTLPDIAWFTRAATPDGERVIRGSFGYEPVPGSRTGLLRRLPQARQGRAA